MNDNDELTYENDIIEGNCSLDKFEYVKIDDLGSDSIHELDNIESKNEKAKSTQIKTSDLLDNLYKDKYFKKQTIFECDICNISFMNPIDLQNHISETQLMEDYDTEIYDYKTDKSCSSDDNTEEDFYDRFIEPMIITLLKENGYESNVSSLNEENNIEYDDNLITMLHQKEIEEKCDMTLACEDKQFETHDEKVLQNDSMIPDYSEENRTFQNDGNFFNKILKNRDSVKDIFQAEDFTSKDIFSCDDCFYKTGEIQYLKWHMETFHEEISFTCEQCDFKSPLQGDLIDHKEDMHKQQVENIELDQIINLNSSIGCKNVGANFMNDFTNDEENDNRSYLIKYEDHNFAEYDDVLINDEETFLIDDRFSNADMNIHEYNNDSISFKEEILMMEQMSEKIKFPCNDCDKLFNWQILLNIHIKSNHVKFYHKVTPPRNIETFYRCDECDKSFNGTHDLYRHKTNVHELVQYSCDKCEYNSQQKKYLKRQVKIHIQLNKECYTEKYEKKEKLKLIKEWKKRIFLIFD